MQGNRVNKNRNLDILLGDETSMFEKIILLLRSVFIFIFYEGNVHKNRNFSTFLFSFFCW